MPDRFLFGDPEHLPHIGPPEPARISHGMSFADYLSIDAINSHSISAGAPPRTIRHMMHAMLKRDDHTESKDLRFGRAIHARLLEPDEFATWPIATPCCRPLKSGDRRHQPCGAEASYELCGNWYCGKHNVFEDANAVKVSDFVTQSEMVRIVAIEAELHEAGQLDKFRRPGWSEVVIEFEFMGLRCKARLDRLPEDKSIILDIKKVRVGRATQMAFGQQCVDYGYYIQAWFYCEAVKALTGEYPLFAWVLLEDDMPHCVNVIHASNTDLKIGREVGTRVLEQWKRCIGGEKPHGYISNKSTCEGALPPYFVKRFAKHDLGPDIISSEGLRW